MIAAAEKQHQAMELRKAGAGFDRIAAACGYADRGGAYNAVLAGLKAAVQEPAEELRQLEVERLDGMLLAIWPEVRRGGHGAIDRALRIGERRAALMGLDRLRFEVSGPAGGAIPISVNQAIDKVYGEGGDRQ